MENGLSAADVALLNNDGMGGWNGMIWLFAILALFSGGFGGFGGGNQQFATRDQVQNGFDTQNMQMQTSGILSAVNAGTAQSVAATNQTFHDSLMANQNLYNEIARDISNVQLGQSQILANQNECCCSTKMLIQQSAADTALQMAQMEARLNAKMDATEIQNLRDKVGRLELAQATSGVLRFPNTWSFDAGQFPPVFATA